VVVVVDSKAVEALEARAVVVLVATVYREPQELQTLVAAVVVVDIPAAPEIKKVVVLEVLV
jgi:hypothetical protein